MNRTLQPGETVVLAGKRGGGKTATAVTMAQHAIQGDYGHENVELITNVIFGRVRDRGPPIEDYPEHVHHEDTLSGTMRKIGEIINEYGSGGCTIIWLLDEAQNFMIADMNGSRENLALTKYLGNARKFDVCNFFLTPAINNLTPRVRCFPTGDTKSGYCSCQMQKDPDAAYRQFHGSVNPRSVTYITTDAGARPITMCMEPSPWVKGVYSKGLKPGTYGYDTKSTASFSIGKNENGVPFSFEKFIMATSGGLSHDLPGKIEAFFDAWECEGGTDQEDCPGEDYTRIRISDQCRRVERMRDMGLTWKQVAAIEGEIMTTLQSRFYKFQGSSNVEDASIKTNDEQCRGYAGAYIYNLKKEGDFRGPGPSREVNLNDQEVEG